MAIENVDSCKNVITNTSAKEWQRMKFRKKIKKHNVDERIWKEVKQAKKQHFC